MWTGKDRDKSKKHIFYMLLQFFIMLCSIIYLDYIYITNIRPDHVGAESFEKTDCFVMSKKISMKGKLLRRARAEFLISYHANGVQYTRWVYGNGLDTAYTTNSVQQEQLLADYKIGGNYTCRFNTTNPEEVLLIMRSGWSMLTPLVIPGLAGLIFLILFIKNGLKLVFAIRKKINKFKMR